MQTKKQEQLQTEEEREEGGNAFRNYRKLQEFSKARQRLAQAAGPSDDCKLARTLLPWPPPESEPELL
jgi:hypothetical protein